MQVQQNDSGDYTLIVKSEYFNDSPPLKINFTINIVDIKPIIDDTNNLAVIISCSIVGVLIVVILVAFIVYKRRKS